MISFIGAGTAASGAYEGDMARAAMHLKNRAQTLDEEKSLTAAVQNQEKLEMEQEQNEWGRVVDQQRMRESEMRVKQGQVEFERYNMLFQEEKAEKEKQKWLAQTGISSAMKIASMNGGIVPESCVNALNRDFNLDPSKGDKFVGGGFQKDGTFVLDFAKTDQKTGQTTIVPQVFTPIHQMKAIQQTGIYDEKHMDTLYKTLMRQGMRPEEIGLGYSNGGKGSAGVEIAKINAASRERVANMRESGLNRRFDKRDKQKTEDREERRRQFDEREKRLAGTGNGGSTNGNKSRIEQMRRLDKQYETALKMGGITEEERQGYLDQIDAERKTLFEQSEADGEKAGLGTSDDGGTRKKVSYNDLKPGDTFTYKGRKCVKTEKGFRYLD